jgi:hypothetical protein
VYEGAHTLNIAEEKNTTRSGMSENRAERLSVLFRTALDTDQDGQVSLGEIMDRVAERGFGLFLILMAIPMLIPMPPGTSGPIGLLYALLGSQMIAGRAIPWLPERMRRYRLSVRVVQLLQTRGVSTLEKIERLSRPRLHALENPVMLRVTGFAVVFIGVILSLPLPFMNSIPAVPVLVFGIGLMNRDGVFLLMGHLLTLTLVGILIGFWHLFKAPFNAMWHKIENWM